MTSDSLLKIFISIAVASTFYISIYFKRKIINKRKPGYIDKIIAILIFVYMIISFFYKDGRIIY